MANEQSRDIHPFAKGLTWSEHRLGDCGITGLDISETFVKIAPGKQAIALRTLSMRRY